MLVSTPIKWLLDRIRALRPFRSNQRYAPCPNRHRDDRQFAAACRFQPPTPSMSVRVSYADIVQSNCDEHAKVHAHNHQNAEVVPPWGVSGKTNATLQAPAHRHPLSLSRDNRRDGRFVSIWPAPPLPTSSSGHSPSRCSSPSALTIRSRMGNPSFHR